MLTWLLLGTVLYLLTAYLPSLFLISGIGIGGYLGTRDEDPEVNALHGRANRASRNFEENYAPFMALGILAFVVPGADMALASTGAMIFVLARLFYLPLYLRGVFFWRSAMFTVGWVGMLIMGVALI
ncbi:MAG: MAPEG family protein [Pseudomonadota bacterium]|uniref:MAPEG family protein n=1 Tax=Thalassovita sp. TaxID=1979401 RepID=UPI002AB040D8|nr:MAPEG family protein [Thalassovita sp.]MEC8039540.1 MAPEG family protein [Pseudomonadota bacterium]